MLAAMSGLLEVGVKPAPLIKAGAQRGEYRDGGLHAARIKALLVCKKARDIAALVLTVLQCLGEHLNAIGDLDDAGLERFCVAILLEGGAPGGKLTEDQIRGAVFCPIDGCFADELLDR